MILEALKVWSLQFFKNATTATSLSMLPIAQRQLLNSWGLKELGCLFRNFNTSSTSSTENESCNLARAQSELARVWGAATLEIKLLKCRWRWHHDHSVRSQERARCARGAWVELQRFGDAWPDGAGSQAHLRESPGRSNQFAHGQWPSTLELPSRGQLELKIGHVPRPKVRWTNPGSSHLLIARGHAETNYVEVERILQGSLTALIPCIQGLKLGPKRVGSVYRLGPSAQRQRANSAPCRRSSACNAALFPARLAMLLVPHQLRLKPKEGLPRPPQTRDDPCSCSQTECKGVAASPGGKSW